MEILPHKIFFGLIDFKTLPFLYLFLGNCVNDGFWVNCSCISISANCYHNIPPARPKAFCRCSWTLSDKLRCWAVVSWMRHLAVLMTMPQPETNRANCMFWCEQNWSKDSSSDSCLQIAVCQFARMLFYYLLFFTSVSWPVMEFEPLKQGCQNQPLKIFEAIIGGSQGENSSKSNVTVSC